MSNNTRCFCCVGFSSTIFSQPKFEFYFDQALSPDTNRTPCVQTWAVGLHGVTGQGRFAQAEFSQTDIGNFLWGIHTNT